MKTIAAALVKAQKEFGPALKTSTNPHFKSRYADLASCIEAVIDALNNNGIYLMQPIHETDSGVVIETLFIHESGETLSAGRMHVPAPKHDPQGYGSAATYGRRYSLMAACGIAPEDDDGNAASRVGTQKKETPQQNLMAQMSQFNSICKKISDATSKASLIATWKEANEFIKQNPEFKENLETAKDQKKLQLESMEAA